jgi:hypothetical protein
MGINPRQNRSPDQDPALRIITKQAAGMQWSGSRPCFAAEPPVHLLIR